MNSVKDNHQKSLEDFLSEVSDLVNKHKETLIPNHKKLNKDRIRYAGSVYDEKEIMGMIEAIARGWFGLSTYGKKFEEKFPKILGKKRGALVNSGSSANLLALTALTSKKMKNQLKKGDEIIAPAAGFPTTINPIIQNNMKLKLVDVEIDTLNIKPDDLVEAVNSKTKAISFAHALGNPAQMDVIMDLAEEFNLYVLEDCCDALGAKWDGLPLGSFGQTATCSFYPAHHITMGEGGFVAVNDLVMDRVVKSFRDWGRDCYCSSQEKNHKGACRKRFEHEIDGTAYDHKYIYTHIGYNMKPTEIQAAMGYYQLEKLDNFIKKRNENFDRWITIFKEYEDIFVLPKIYKKSEPSWFAFPITLKENTSFTRREFQEYLEYKGIETRLFFGGNIIKHPAYSDIAYKSVGSLSNSDQILRNTLFLGVYPGLDIDSIEFAREQISNFINLHQRS